MASNRDDRKALATPQSTSLCPPGRFSQTETNVSGYQSVLHGDKAAVSIRDHVTGAFRNPPLQSGRLRSALWKAAISTGKTMVASSKQLTHGLLCQKVTYGEAGGLASFRYHRICQLVFRRALTMLNYAGRWHVPLVPR